MNLTKTKKKVEKAKLLAFEIKAYGGKAFIAAKSISRALDVFTSHTGINIDSLEYNISRIPETMYSIVKFQLLPWENEWTLTETMDKIYNEAFLSADKALYNKLNPGVNVDL